MFVVVSSVPADSRSTEPKVWTADYVTQVFEANGLSADVAKKTVAVCQELGIPLHHAWNIASFAHTALGLGITPDQLNEVRKFSAEMSDHELLWHKIDAVSALGVPEFFRDTLGKLHHTLDGAAKLMAELQKK